MRFLTGRVYIPLVKSCLQEQVKSLSLGEGVTFDDDVTCEEVVFLRTHRVTFLACMVPLSYYDMNLIKDYESDSSSAEGTDNAGRADLDYSSKPANPNNEIDVRSVRKVYLITYSQADVVHFPTRHSFVEAVLYSFHNAPAKIMHWSCWLEEHPKSCGSHFHMAQKLDRNQRWLPSKRFL